MFTNSEFTAKMKIVILTIGSSGEIPFAVYFFCTIFCCFVDIFFVSLSTHIDKLHFVFCSAVHSYASQMMLGALRTHLVQ